MFGKKKSLVGLDIGSHSVKAVELMENAGHVKLVGFGQAPVPSEDQLRDAVTQALKRAGIKTREVATAVCGRSVIVRYVNMVSMSDEELQSALRFEADKYIPFDIDEVILSCQRLEEIPAEENEEKEMKVLLVAVKKSLIDEHVSLLNQLGLSPRVVDVDSFAMGNAFELRSMNSPRVEDEDRVVALVDIGAAKSNINIMRGNLSYFSREVYLAGNDFTEAVSRRLGISIAEAEKLKCSPGDRSDEVEDAILPVLDDLANEVHLSFDYYENQYDRQVEEIYISGGSSGLPGLEAAFERIFNRKVSFWDPTENMEIKSDRFDVDQMKAIAPQLAVAVGLASRILD